MTRTPNYKFDLVPFDTRPWHEREHDNWRQLDAILATLTTIVNIVGVWSNSTAYTVGERLVDGDTGSIWTCAVDHVSASTGTFAADRAANPTYWLTFTVDQRFRGTWVSGEDYLVNDFVVSGSIYAAATTAHTAGATFAGDSANWAYLVDLTTDLAAIAVSVSAAASSAANAAASAATVNLPSMVGESLGMLRANLGETGYEFRTPAEVLSDISAQASSSKLTDIAALAVTDGNVIVGNGATWVAESGATARTSLGLAIGTDVQAYDADTVKTDVAQTFTAPQRADQATVTDGTLDLSAAQNFHYTPAAGDTLEFSNESVGQSGLIYLVNGSNYAITLGAEITGPTSMATIISVTGNYLVSYWVHTAGGGADTVACSFVEVV